MLQAVAQHRDHAALSDLALQSCQKAPACGAVILDVEGDSGLRLCGAKKRGQLPEIDAVLPVVVVRLAFTPAGDRRSHLPNDQRLEAELARIASHAPTSPGRSSR